MVFFFNVFLRGEGDTNESIQFFFQYEFFREMTIKVKMNNQTSLVDTMLGIIVQLKKKIILFLEINFIEKIFFKEISSTISF